MIPLSGQSTGSLIMIIQVFTLIQPVVLHQDIIHVFVLTPVVVKNQTMVNTILEVPKFPTVRPLAALPLATLAPATPLDTTTKPAGNVSTIETLG